MLAVPEAKSCVRRKPQQVGGMKDWLTIRNALGALLLYMAFKCAAMTRPGGFAVMGPAIGSMICLVLAGIFFSRSLSEFLARPFTRFIDGIYFGSNDREPPPVNLKLAVIYRGERRYEDAIAEYERQLESHPRSLELWSELIRTAREAGSLNEARQYFGKARRRVRRDDREQLEREFSWL